METMQAAMLVRPGGALELREIAIPEPGPGELLIKLEACGVCHTDLHVQAASSIPSADGGPLILGHEGIGRVVKRGPGAGRYQIDDRVGLPWLHDTCGHCRECLTGWESFCADQRAHGYTVHGGFAEYAVVKERFTARIPDGLSPIAAAPMLCAGVTAYGAIRKVELEPGKRCMVIGCGGLGLYAIQLARQFGAEVVAVDTSEAKLALAQELGARHVFLAQDAPGAKIRALGGADACLNFAPSAKPWRDMLTAVNPRGWIVAVAMVPDEVALSMEWLTYNGVRITGSSVGTRQELADLLAIGSRGQLAMPIETVPLSGVNEALGKLDAGAVNGRLVIDFSR
jgi:propanol-preferring alcohol dehydrogenase